MWAHWVEMRTEWGSIYGASWGAVESDLSMEQVLDQRQASFFAQSTAPLAIVVEDGPASQQAEASAREIHDVVLSAADVPWPASRFVVSQAWWIASELGRRTSQLQVRYSDRWTGSTAVSRWARRTARLTSS